MTSQMPPRTSKYDWCAVAADSVVAMGDAGAGDAVFSVAADAESADV